VYKGAVGSRPLDETALVARAKQGEQTAYEELVRMHQNIAFRVALVAGLDPAEAEDAVQDGFVKAYRALGRFRAGSPFRPWLLAIVANEARNRRRSAGRRAQLAARAAALDASGGAAQSPEAATLDEERRAVLLAALDRLRDEDRQVLACRYLLDLSEAETAASLGLRLGTVKSRTSRALERLRVELGEASL
jgi:RNA polymerase sigma-70 factor (ECF subfamily)